MKLISLSTRNFRLHAHSDVTFPESGVVGILGTNEAGKSTLLEAAVWALFGGDTTRGTRAGLRWHRAPARRKASVTLRFSLASRTYRIERDESSASLVDEGSGQVLVEGTAAVNQHVPQLLGMTHSEFSASYLCGQKDLTRIAAMLPTERVAFVRQVLGMGRIDEGLKACRKAKAALADERRGLEAGLGERGPLLEAVEGADLALHEAHGAKTARLEALLEVEAVRDASRAQLEASTAQKTEHDQLTRAVENATRSVEHAAAEAGRLELLLTKQREASDHLLEVEPQLQPLPGLRAERDELVSARAAASERQRLEEYVEKLVADTQKLELQIPDDDRLVGLFDAQELVRASKLAGELDEKVELLRTARLENRTRQLAAAEGYERDAALAARKLAAIRAAGAGGGCPTCLRELAEAFDTVVATLEVQERKARNAAEDCRIDAEESSHESDDEIETAVARDEAVAEVERLRKLERQADDAAERVTRAREWIAEFARRLEESRARLAALPERTWSPERLAQVEAEIQRLEALDRSLATERGLAAQVTETEQQLQRRRDERARAEAERDRAQRALEELRFDTVAHRCLEEAAEQARQAVEDARVVLARAQEAERGATHRLHAAEGALAEYDRRATRLREVLAQHHAHERADARLSEFRVAIAATIRPELEELMSGFVHLLTDGRHEAVTLSEDFTATLHEAGVPTEVISGGTEDVAALAMRLAISQMIAERAGHPLELLVLDEPFGSLDAVRRANVLALIRRLGGIFRQVVVISHVEETRDAVDHVVELEFDEGAGMTRVVSAPVVEPAPELVGAA